MKIIKFNLINNVISTKKTPKNKKRKERDSGIAI